MKISAIRLDRSVFLSYIYSVLHKKKLEFFFNSLDEANIRYSDEQEDIFFLRSLQNHTTMKI